MDKENCDGVLFAGRRGRQTVKVAVVDGTDLDEFATEAGIEITSKPKKQKV